MLKPFLAAVAFSACLATAAAAAPTSSEDCLKQAISLAEKAEDKTDLAEDKLTKIEDLLTQLEKHCEAGAFAEAETVSKSIEAEIGN